MFSYRAKLLVAVVFATSFLFVCLAKNAHAELPPGSYDALRKKAKEAVIIQVTAVEKQPVKAGIIKVTLKAKILHVERSKTNLKKMQTIVIKYTHIDPRKVRFVGARPVPLLKQGEVYPAFLNPAKQGKFYQPAAYGESFRMTPEK